MGTESDNGGHEQGVQPHLTITVTDTNIFSLSLSGTFPTLDYALNMLDQARRELDARWRLERTQSVMQQAADQQLARDLTRRR